MVTLSQIADYSISDGIEGHQDIDLAILTALTQR